MQTLLEELEETCQTEFKLESKATNPARLPSNTGEFKLGRLPNQSGSCKEPHSHRTGEMGAVACKARADAHLLHACMFI